MIAKPVLDLDQLELNGIRIYDAYEQETEVRIKYFKDQGFCEIVCNIDAPIDIWSMIIKCSNGDGKKNIPFDWIVQVENIKI